MVRSPEGIVGCTLGSREGERAIVQMFRASAVLPVPDERLPFDPATDTVAYEFAFKHGRADIVIFHFDGSATIIEAKDGTRGYMHVAQGIGQVGLYAAQLSQSRIGLAKVRRCLLWTSTGDICADAFLEIACEQAGVIALPWGLLSDHMAAALSVVPR
jgi:hypothetical protein